MTKSEFDITRFHNGMRVKVSDQDFNGIFPILGVDFEDGLLLIKQDPDVWICYSVCELIN